jgi:RNA polymerase sigma-70 factor (ECF subfamily)
VSGNPLTVGFIAGAQDRWGGGNPDIEDRLGEAVLRGRRAWPDLEIGDATFARHLGRCLAGDPDPVAALRSRHIEDLYLLAAVAERDRQALKHFSKAVASETSSALARSHPSGTMTDDIQQMVLELVLVGEADAKPKLSQYSGRGPLRAWLRVIAVRKAARLWARWSREDSFDEEAAFDSMLAQNDAELAIAKGPYRAAFRRSFQVALAELSAWDREILRSHLSKGVDTRTLAQQHGVHRGTVARWLEKIRESLRTRTRHHLQSDCGVGLGEFDTLARLVLSRLDFSVGDLPAAGARSRKK